MIVHRRSSACPCRAEPRAVRRCVRVSAAARHRVAVVTGFGRGGRDFDGEKIARGW